MPIEIKELVVKFTVEESGAKGIVTDGSAHLTKDDTNKLINQCVEKVLEKLERHQER